MSDEVLHEVFTQQDAQCHTSTITNIIDGGLAEIAHELKNNYGDDITNAINALPSEEQLDALNNHLKRRNELAEELVKLKRHKLNAKRQVIYYTDDLEYEEIMADIAKKEAEGYVVESWHLGRKSEYAIFRQKLE